MIFNYVVFTFQQRTIFDTQTLEEWMRREIDRIECNKNGKKGINGE